MWLMWPLQVFFVTKCSLYCLFIALLNLFSSTIIKIQVFTQKYPHYIKINCTHFCFHIFIYAFEVFSYVLLFSIHLLYASYPIFKNHFKLHLPHKVFSENYNCNMNLYLLLYSFYIPKVTLFYIFLNSSFLKLDVLTLYYTNTLFLYMCKHVVIVK